MAPNNPLVMSATADETRCDDSWMGQPLKEPPTASIMISHLKHNVEDLFSPPELPINQQTEETAKVTTAFVPVARNNFGAHLDPMSVPRAPENIFPVFEDRHFDLVSRNGISNYLTDQGKKSNGLILM